MTTSPSKAFPHIMLDIESMSLHPTNALILSVGMVQFDPWAPTFDAALGERKLILPDINQQLLLGRHVDPGTQDFWSKQKPEASQHWMNGGEPDLLTVACNRIEEFIKGATGIWAQGILFDLGNIDGLFRQVQKRPAPWHYRAPRDARTYCEEVAHDHTLDDVDLTAEYNIVEHEPISDCIVQAHRVWTRYPKNRSDL